MSNDKHMIMSWPKLGISVELKPNDDGANKWIYDWYYDHLPVRFLQLHSVVTGDVAYTFFDIGDTLPCANDTDHKLVTSRINANNRGKIHFSYNVPNGLSGGNVSHIGQFYGPTFEDMAGYTSAVCVSEEDCDKLEKALNLCHDKWYHDKEPIHCEITKK